MFDKGLFRRNHVWKEGYNWKEVIFGWLETWNVVITISDD